MKNHYITVSLVAAALLLSASLALAVENQADVPQKAASKVIASPKNVKSETNAKHKVAAKIKLVNINGATSEELKKLPGIGDADAAKIIAGRPYGSKAWLVSNNIIDRGTFERIKKLIVAKQPYKDGAKNAAIYKKW